MNYVGESKTSLKLRSKQLCIFFYMLYLFINSSTWQIQKIYRGFAFSQWLVKNGSSVQLEMYLLMQYYTYECNTHLKKFSLGNSVK